MTREELLALVNKELGRTKLTLNERAINEELDDSLSDFGDDAEANAKLVTRIANRLKRMDGSVHSAVSHEVEEYKKNYKPKPSSTTPPAKEGDEDDDDDKDTPAWAKKLNKRLDDLENARKAEKAERDKKDLLDSVRKGLKDKFDEAGLELNSFFLKTTLEKLQIPEKDADVATLVEQAEKNYNSYVKEANVDFGKPASGGKGGASSQKEDEHEFDDIAARRKRYNPNPSND